jgi:hypothetical protein
LILDRYMKNATEAEREAARDSLRAFAEILVAIARRRALEGAGPTRESGEGAIDFSKRPPPPS